MNIWRYLPLILILFPLAGAATLSLVRGRSAIRWTAFGFLCAILVLSILIARDLDGLSLPLVIATTFICLCAGLASWSASYSPRLHLVLLLCLESGVLGTLLSTTFTYFFISFELCVIPIGWMLENWHGSRRPYAADKALIYKFFGSVCLLIAGIGVNHYAGTTDLSALASSAGRAAFAPMARPFFILCMLAFLIRLGAFPFHNWLADLQSQSPPPIAMLLAGLIPMTGGYGILRIALPLFPQTAFANAHLLMLLGLLGIFYGGACALTQKDFRKRIAYTTIANLAFAVLGIGILNVASLEGAIYVILSQILTGAMLLFASGVDHDDFGGLAVFAAIGIPGLCGFVGQFMILLGLFESSLSPFHAGLLATAICLGGLLTAASLLKCLRPAASEDVVEIDSKQRVALLLLATAIVLLGLAPAAIVLVTAPTLTAIFKSLLPM